MENARLKTKAKSSKKGKVLSDSDFYNFRNVNDLNIAIS